MNKLVEGSFYTREAIAKLIGGDTQSYLPSRDKQIVCAALDPASNPEAPDKILCGSGPQVMEKGAMLATQGGRIPVFMKQATGEWVYRGIFEVTGSSTDPGVLTAECGTSGRADISRVIYLVKVHTRVPFRWVMTATGSLDLQLADPAALDADAVAFIRAKMLEFDTHPPQSAQDLPRGVLDLLKAVAGKGHVLTAGEVTAGIYKRNGYLNLFRWCKRTHYIAKSALANELWKFLFGDIREAGDLCDNIPEDDPQRGQIRVNADAWKTWYEYISGEKVGATDPLPGDRMSSLFDVARQIVLYGPPGTGKTWAAMGIAAAMLGVDRAGLKACRFKAESPSGSWALVQFHPSYNYEDFIRGISVKTESGRVVYRAENKLFVELCQAASAAMTTDDKQPRKYILIIDEINRANLAAVFGELIYALEYRGKAVKLPYATGDDDRLVIPPNLYIIGTMNTADRSIGHIDYALRRRFVFYPYLANSDALENYYASTGGSCSGMALELFRALEQALAGDAVSSDYSAGEIMPGHTYFIADTKEDLLLKMRYQVIPLLKEYFSDGILTADIADTFKAMVARYE
ncbi:MAG: AAA family ATPase [Planctomycetota bacterium]